MPAHERRQKYLRETCVKLQSDLRSQGIDNQYVEVGLKETFLNDMEIAICNTKQPRNEPYPEETNWHSEIANKIVSATLHCGRWNIVTPADLVLYNDDGVPERLLAGLEKALRKTPKGSSAQVRLIHFQKDVYSSLLEVEVTGISDPVPLEE